MKSITHIVLALALVLAALTEGYGSKDAAVKIIVVEGESPIYQAGLVQARDRALTDAFRKAVRKVLGAFVSAESYTKNFVSIDDSILTKAKGYIKSYEVLSEYREGNVLALETKVTVSVEPIKDSLTALGLLIESMGNPRIVIRVADKDQGGRPLNNHVSSVQIREIFVDKGFKVLERPQEAEVLIVGEGSVENVSSVGAAGIIGSIVRLNLKALASNTREVIASESVRMNGAGPNIDAALQAAYRSAARRAADSLIDKISRKWTGQVLNGRDIAIHVLVDNYSKLHRFRKRLGYIFGIQKLDQRSFADRSAVLDVRFTGSPQLLTDLIQESNFEDVKVEVIRFASDKIELRVE